MGLLGMLAGLPIAPLKGVAALARHLQQQAEREWEEEFAELQAMLLELESLDDIEGEDLASKEAELLARIGALAGARPSGEET